MLCKKTVLVVMMLLGLAMSRGGTDPHLRTYLRKGMTYQAQEFPVEGNNWAGKMSCNGCDPLEGDTPCTDSLPLLCILHHKTIDRPLYAFSPIVGPYENPDQGYYNGWTGGILVVTPPVRGYDVDSFSAGNQICQDYYGDSAKFAEFKDGYYMDYMNQLPRGTWKFWDWTRAQCGAWGMWGYFNHGYNGRAWVWIESQANGNCGDV